MAIYVKSKLVMSNMIAIEFQLCFRNNDQITRIHNTELNMLKIDSYASVYKD